MKTFLARKQIHNIYKSQLSVIIVHLAQQQWDDAIAAQEKFFETDGYAVSDQGYCGTQLMESFEKSDENMLQETLNSNCLKYLENCISKIAKSLKIYKVTSTKKLNKNVEAKNKKLFGESDDDDLNSSDDEENGEKKR